MHTKINKNLNVIFFVAKPFIILLFFWVSTTKIKYNLRRKFLTYTYDYRVT